MEVWDGAEGWGSAGWSCGMEVWDEGPGLSRWAPALRDPPRDARASGSCRRSHLRDARGWNIFPRGESLRELSQRRGFAGELSGIFLGEAAVRGRSVQKASSRSDAASVVLGFPGAGCSLCGGVSPGGAGDAPRQLVLAAAGAPGPRSCSAGDGAERGPRDGTGESGFGNLRTLPAREESHEYLAVERCAALAAGSLSVSAFL